jgi:hypothetical protein
LRIVSSSFRTPFSLRISSGSATTLPLAGLWQIARDAFGTVTGVSFRLFPFTVHPQIFSEVACATTKRGREMIAAARTEIRKHRIVFSAFFNESDASFAFRHRVRSSVERKKIHTTRYGIYTDQLLLADND